MRCLLDTHALIWALSEAKKLPKNVRSMVEDPENEIFVSAASAWEIAIKSALGKIEFPLVDLGRAAAAAGLVELPVCLRHAVAVRDLPMHHRDPFDRILVVQALQENLYLVTHDPVLASYGVRTMWGEPGKRSR